MRSPIGMNSANAGLMGNTPVSKRAEVATKGATGVVAVGGNIANIQKIDLQEDSIMPDGVDDTFADFVRKWSTHFWLFLFS